MFLYVFLFHCFTTLNHSFTLCWYMTDANIVIYIYMDIYIYKNIYTQYSLSPFLFNTHNCSIFRFLPLSLTRAQGAVASSTLRSKYFAQFTGASRRLLSLTHITSVQYICCYAISTPTIAFAWITFNQVYFYIHFYLYLSVVWPLL